MTPIMKPSADELLAKELVERARSEGAQLVGPGGLLTDLTKTVLETALEEMAAWQSRPLDEVYPVIFIDAIQVKIRDGQVANRPVYTVIGVTVDGMRDMLGLWVGDGGEGAKYWHQVLSEIRNRGVNDVCILVCDGLRGLVESVNDVWPLAIVQTCVLHLVRNTFR